MKILFLSSSLEISPMVTSHSSRNCADGGLEARRHVAELAADAGVGGGETGAGELLAEVVDLFPLGEGVEENGHRADVHGADADAEHVGGNAGEFAAEHAQGLAARRQRPAHQFFDGAGVGDVVGERSEVVQPVRVGHELVVVHVFRDLLVAAVEETDVRDRPWWMISPSSSRISRSTPWVAGWEGPMLRTMRSPTRSSVSAW